MRDVAHVRFATVFLDRGLLANWVLRACMSETATLASPNLSSGAFLDSGFLANWGFVGPCVRKRYGRGPWTVSWTAILGFQYELPTWIINIGRWAADLAVSPCRQSGLPAWTASRSILGSRPSDAMRMASTSQRPHPKVSEQASGQLSRTRRTTFPLRIGLGRQRPSCPYVRCRHGTSCPPSLNLLSQKHIGTTRGGGFGVFC